MNDSPAFPTEKWWKNAQGKSLTGGLTKREWFAGMALSGNLGDPNRTVDDMAWWAFAQADAMIAESKKEPTK